MEGSSPGAGRGASGGQRLLGPGRGGSFDGKRVSHRGDAYPERAPRGEVAGPVGMDRKTPGSSRRGPQPGSNPGPQKSFAGRLSPPPSDSGHRDYVGSKKIQDDGRPY